MTAEIKPTADVYERAARAWALDINSRMTIPFPADAEPLSEFTAHRAEASAFRAAVESAFAAGVSAERVRIVAALRVHAGHFRWAEPGSVFAVADMIERDEP